jgi:hypothetical protein
MMEGMAERGHVTTRGGPQLPWQRLEADAALVKQVCDRIRNKVDCEHNATSDSVAMDGRLISNLVELTIR